MNEDQLRQARVSLVNEMRLMENRLVLMKAEKFKLEAALEVYGGCDKIIEVKVIEEKNGHLFI